MADELDPSQVGQQRQPKEESTVERWRRRQVERGYNLYRISANRRLLATPLLNNIIARRNERRGISEEATLADEQKRRFRRRKRQQF